MNKNGFDNRATGQLVPTIGGRKAFVPDPLPPRDIAGIYPKLIRVPGVLETSQMG